MFETCTEGYTEMCNLQSKIGVSLESAIPVLAFTSLEHNDVHTYELTA
jgi:hypothetical protein